MPLLLAATLTTGAAAPSAALAANAGYSHSMLLSPRSPARCPPGFGAFYRADAIVTGTDMRQRPSGFARALREVLVKASGDPRLADDPRTGELAAHADRLVACFAYDDLMAALPLHDDQGTYDRPYRLTVFFAPAKIDDALRRLGARPWRDERPVVVPILLVHGPKPPAYVLSAEIPAGAEERSAFAAAAGGFGLQGRFPGSAELLRWGAGADRLPGALPSSGAAEAVVVGTLDWHEALPGWVGKWRMRWRGAGYAWGIGGVNYDAAFRNIVRGVVLVASGTGPPDRGD